MEEYKVYPVLNTLAGLSLGYMLVIILISLYNKDYIEAGVRGVGLLVSIGWLYTIYEMQWR